MNKPITRNPEILGNQPCLTGTRIRPKDVTERIGAGESIGEICKALNLGYNQVMDALRYRCANPDQRDDMTDGTELKCPVCWGKSRDLMKTYGAQVMLLMLHQEEIIRLNEELQQKWHDILNKVNHATD